MTHRWRERLFDEARLHLVFAGLVAVGTVVLAVVGVLAFVAEEPSSGSASTTTTSRAADRTTPVDRVPTTAPAEAVLLGRDLAPSSSDPCRTRGYADGSAWQLGDVPVAGEQRAPSYYCNLFAGGSGSIDFLLGRAYRKLTLTIGLSDDSSARHRVRFEIVGDETRYLAEPRTFSLGEVEEITVDLTGTTRLRLAVTELGQPGGVDTPSKPVFARAVLTPAS